MSNNKIVKWTLIFTSSVHVQISATSEKDDLAHNFSTGDNVEVIEGELMNLQGKVLAVDGSKITIQPKHEDLKDPLEFQVTLRSFQIILFHYKYTFSYLKLRKK